jgi:hypothetical protein
MVAKFIEAENIMGLPATGIMEMSCIIDTKFIFVKRGSSKMATRVRKQNA